MSKKLIHTHVPVKREETPFEKKVETLAPIVRVSPTPLKTAEISPLQVMGISDVLKDSGADSHSQVIALAKILRILKVV